MKRRVASLSDCRTLFLLSMLLPVLSLCAVLVERRQPRSFLSIGTPGKGVYGLFCVVWTSRVPEKTMDKDALQSEQPFLFTGSYNFEVCPYRCTPPPPPPLLYTDSPED